MAVGAIPWEDDTYYEWVCFHNALWRKERTTRNISMVSLCDFARKMTKKPCGIWYLFQFAPKNIADLLSRTAEINAKSYTRKNSMVTTFAWSLHFCFTSILLYRWIAFVGLTLIALGTGGIKPCVSAFGADQFDDDMVRTAPWKSLWQWWPSAPHHHTIFCWLLARLPTHPSEVSVRTSWNKN